MSEPRSSPSPSEGEGRGGGESAGSVFLLPIEALRRRRGAKWHRYGPDVLPAWLADMDYAVAEPVRRAMARLVEEGDYGYPRRTGAGSVEVAFAERMAERFGWRPSPERVVVVADLVQALLAAVAALSEPGDGVLVHTPIYPPFLDAIDRTGRRRVSHPLVDDGSRLGTDPERLAASVDAGTRMLLLCNPHNPSGRVLERSELEAVARVAVDRDLVVVADEVHCDMVFPGHAHVPLATLGGGVAERTVTINSATKSFNIPGLRCGVMHFGSAALLARFRRTFPERMLGTVGAPGLDATVAAWREGQPWLDAVMALLLANRDRVAAWASARAPALRHRPPEATYLAWFDCGGLGLPAGVTAQRFFLDEARVALNGGPEFGPGGDAGVRLTFATSPAILEQLLERMDDAIRRSPGSVR